MRRGYDRPVDARERLVAELREHALIIGEVVLTSGKTAQYYVDAKRAVLRPAGFAALSELVASYCREFGATAAGGHSSATPRAIELFRACSTMHGMIEPVRQ